MSFKLCKEDFHEWGKGNMESRGNFMEKKGEKMKVSFEWRRGKMMILQQSFLMKSTEFLSKKGNSSEDLDKGMRPSKAFKCQHFLAIKFVP